MSDDYWYKRYPSDFITGTLNLTLEEKGAFSICLDLMYDQNGPIPDDHRWIAGVCGVSVRKWKSLLKRLIILGKLSTEGGFISNERALKEIENRAKTARKHAENGSKGGDKTAENRVALNKNNDLPPAGLQHRARVLEARVRIEEEGKIIIKRSAIENDFDLWWKAYPRRQAKADARKNYERILKNGDATVDEMFEGAVRYADAVKGENPKFTKMAATWLNKGCWTDEMLPADQSQDRSRARQRGDDVEEFLAWADEITDTDQNHERQPDNKILRIVE